MVNVGTSGGHERRYGGHHDSRRRTWEHLHLAFASSASSASKISATTPPPQWASPGWCLRLLRLLLRWVKARPSKLFTQSTGGEGAGRENSGACREIVYSERLPFIVPEGLKQWSLFRFHVVGGFPPKQNLKPQRHGGKLPKYVECDAQGIEGT